MVFNKNLHESATSRKVSFPKRRSRRQRSRGSTNEGTQPPRGGAARRDSGTRPRPRRSAAARPARPHPVPPSPRARPRRQSPPSFRSPGPAHSRAARAHRHSPRVPGRRRERGRSTPSSQSRLPPRPHLLRVLRGFFSWPLRRAETHLPTIQNGGRPSLTPSCAGSTASLAPSEARDSAASPPAPAADRRITEAVPLSLPRYQGKRQKDFPPAPTGARAQPAEPNRKKRGGGSACVCRAVRDTSSAR